MKMSGWEEGWNEEHKRKRQYKNHERLLQHHLISDVQSSAEKSVIRYMWRQSDRHQCHFLNLLPGAKHGDGWFVTLKLTAWIPTRPWNRADTESACRRSPQVLPPPSWVLVSLLSYCFTTVSIKSAAQKQQLIFNNLSWKPISVAPWIRKRF